MKKTTFSEPREPETFDGSTGKADPPPKVKLGDISTQRGVRRAIAKVIHASVKGEIEHFEARGLVWMLREHAGQIYDADMEERLRSMEQGGTRLIEAEVRRLN